MQIDELRNQLIRYNNAYRAGFIINKKNGWLKLINFGDMTNIEIAKQVLGEDCEEYCTLVEEPPYKGYDVVACNPNEEFLGNPTYVLIKNGKGHIAVDEEYDDLLFREIDD
ncbi:MAG: hypothetical protein J6X91_00440 [Bacteroidales bacterium]|nr:hypothetical protein [Bacteroidales bacterium]